MLPKSFALFKQLLKFGGMRRDPSGCAVVVGCARLSRSLLDELADIVPKNRDPVVEFYA